jgi:hypothetical protein
MLHATRRLLVPLLATLACLTLVGTAQADTTQADTTPVERYAPYQPQTTCSPTAKVGTVALGRWLVRTYGGHTGRITESCKGGGVSEHKEGRAFDWSLDATTSADRARAQRFLTAAFATGPSGEPAELARRMGIMYVIWNDHIYSSYRQFAVRAYKSSSCKTLAKCSKTLRHRDHLHISLTRWAAAGRYSWYVGRVPAARIR